MAYRHAYPDKTVEKNYRGKIAVCFMLAAFYSLWLTINPVRLLLAAVLWVMSCWIVWRYFRSGISFDKKQILLQLAIMLFSSVRFYEYWSTSGRLKQLINSMFSIESSQFLVIAALLMIIISFYGVNVLLYSVQKTFFFKRYIEWPKHIPCFGI